MGVGVARRLKLLVGMSDEHRDFECVGCGRGFEANRQQCPACDGFDIRRS